MNDSVSCEREGDLAIVTINNPPVNALAPGVPEGIVAALNSVADDPNIKAVVLIGAGKTFIAGADIKEFAKIVSGDRPKLDLNVYLNAIEDFKKPIVAAIHGMALGGGLETAMAAHYRVIAPGSQIGQPEVKLGLIPGAGGTQRLPRLAGVAKAVDMCAGGESIKAEEAVQLGIVDRLIEGDFAEGAANFAREMAGKPIPRSKDRGDKLQGFDPQLFVVAREQARTRGRGMIAPDAAIDAVEAATKMPFEEGLKREAELFEKCLYSTQSKALIHVFFGERTVGKIPGLSKGVKPLEIRKAAVVGAGTMGGGIAMTYANAGIPVMVKETAQEALDRGMANIRKNYASTVAKERLTQADMDARLALISPQLDYAGFESADIITEAVFENMAAKKQVFGELDGVAKPEAILASNTSSLDIDEIASATKRPEKVIGNHFFSPANVMKLLEVVRGKATSDEVIATSMALGKKLGKVAVLAGNARGFIGNRMVAPYLREAHFLVEEGASVEQVNEALYEFGMAMGPLAVDDLSGLDISAAIRKEFAAFEKPGVRKALVPELLVQQGRFGQKTGRGWSVYDPQRRASPDPETAALIEQTAREAGIGRREISNEEIVERCIYALVNEGAHILGEGIALRAVDIDITYVYGYGFPAWRGGPMHYADTVGLKQVLARIEDFERNHGSDLWSPAPLLKDLAAQEKSFEVFDEEKELSARG